MKLYTKSSILLISVAAAMPVFSCPSDIVNPATTAFTASTTSCVATVQGAGGISTVATWDPTQYPASLKCTTPPLPQTCAGQVAYAINAMPHVGGVCPTDTGYTVASMISAGGGLCIANLNGPTNVNLQFTINNPVPTSIFCANPGNLVSKV